VIVWIKAGAPETGGGAPSSASTPTPAAPAAAAWSDFEAAFSMKCGTCHVTAQLGGLSLKTYADALKGGKSGPAIVPGDPDKSVLVQVQQKGDHPNLLSPQEFDALLAWIKAGAPETASSAPTPTPAAIPSVVESWTGGIEQIFNAKCAACHIQSQSGGLSLKSYADALKGGGDGPVIVPNDLTRVCWCKYNKRAATPLSFRLTNWIASSRGSKPARRKQPGDCDTSRTVDLFGTVE